MPSSEYHRRQADVLVRIAKSTREPDTARQLMAIAAEHIRLAETDEAPREFIVVPDAPKEASH